MTLLELSVHYAENAAALRARILLLQAAAQAAPDPAEARRHRHRADVLRPLMREARELAVLTARYYDRSYHRNEAYTL